MFIELVESLRCPRAHEFTWLVASTLEMAGRDIRRGLLGCPSCSARYPIRDGIVDFQTRDGTTPIPDSTPLASASGDAELAMRVAALFDLTSPGGFIVLAGDWAHAAPALLGVVDGVEVLVLNTTVALTSGNGISLARTDGSIPIRPGRPAPSRSTSATPPTSARLRAHFASMDAWLRPWELPCLPTSRSSPAMGATGWPRSDWRRAKRCLSGEARVVEVATDAGATEGFHPWITSTSHDDLDQPCF